MMLELVVVRTLVDEDEAQATDDARDRCCKNISGDR